ncbi:MAG: glutathione peroxidase [Ignavibacteriaceae bacterium]|nr:glutathione peroxidase [Ignavibacteriaceae bacterium]
MRTNLIFFFFVSMIILTGISKTSFAQENETKGEGAKVSNIHGIEVKDMDGKAVKLSDYKGKVLLIVNVASKCGYTKQYTGLEAIYRKYKDQGFEILAFPCNDFGGQEPGSNEEIAEFCSSRFDVTFKLFDKIEVLKNKAPLYAVLTDNPVTGTEDIKWNFEKFLIDKEGNIVSRYKSKVTPESEEMTSAIERLLIKK